MLTIQPIKQVPLGNGIVGQVAAQGTTLHIPDVSSHPTFSQSQSDLLLGMEASSPPSPPNHSPRMTGGRLGKHETTQRQESAGGDERKKSDKEETTGNEDSVTSETGETTVLNMEKEKGIPPRNMLLCPIINPKTKEVLGVLVAADKKMGRSFTPGDITLLEQFALLSSIAIENAQIFQQLYTVEKYVKNGVKQTAAHLTMEFGLDGRVKKCNCDPMDVLDIDERTVTQSHYSVWLTAKNETLHDALDGVLSKKGDKDTYTLHSYSYSSPKGRAVMMNIAIFPKLSKNYEIMGAIAVISNVRKSLGVLHTIGKVSYGLPRCAWKSNQWLPFKAIGRSSAAVSSSSPSPISTATSSQQRKGEIISSLSSSEDTRSSGAVSSFKSSSTCALLIMSITTTYGRNVREQKKPEYGVIGPDEKRKARRRGPSILTRRKTIGHSRAYNRSILSPQQQKEQQISISRLTLEDVCCLYISFFSFPFSPLSPTSPFFFLSLSLSLPRALLIRFHFTISSFSLFSFIFSFSSVTHSF